MSINLDYLLKFSGTESISFIYIYLPKLLCLSYLFIHLTIDLIAKNWVALFQFINTFHQPSHEKSTCVTISSNEYMI